MKTIKGISIPLATLLFVTCLAAPQALATPPAPAWSVQALAGPTNFKPGDVSGHDRYEAFFTNSGGKVTDKSPITITDSLPDGLAVKGVRLQITRQPFDDIGPSACHTEVTGEASTVTCTIEEGVLPKAEEPATLYPSEQLWLVVRVEVPPTASGPLANRVEVSGGGAGGASAIAHNQASEEEKAPAGFQEFHATLTGPDGKPVGGADSHPYQYTTSFAVNLDPGPPDSRSTIPFVPAEGDLRDIEVALPPGLIGNPTSVARCTAQQFNTVHGIPGGASGNSANATNACPDGSAVGLVRVEQLEGSGGLGATYPLYNLVPPPGMPAQLGFQVFGLPFYINAKLRSDSDYGITAFLDGITEAKRVTAARVTIWGTPAEASHDRQRGLCLVVGHGNCPAELGSVKPFFRLPSSCASPLGTTMGFDTWLHPGTFVEALFEEAAPIGCELPPFDPSIEAKPTTNVADAPSGLHFDLHLPQAENEDPEGLSEADLRTAKVTLPQGLLVNPSSADGLEGCSLSQVGYRGIEEGRETFSAAAPECPDASKVGKVEVDTPLVDHPLPGAVYLANPHENPFNSLIAIYITVDDPQTGVVVKLSGKVEPDPVSGQLTTTVKESPQTPFEDFKLDFFEGARAPLRTPAICGTHTTTTSLTPWTAPASGPDATPSDSFETTKSPSGGACPGTPSAQPNSPDFGAGTAAPVAGAFSPFTLRLARQDGSQELKGLEVTLPPGLTGKLAGLAYCSDGALASTASKSGRAEQASPSCPASSELGKVTVAAGAGPAPFHAQGKAYLAGPYKGAPISMVVITPAVAGPFDLGTVVVRAALQVDPETARIHAISDPLPTILQGIPLDVRSIALQIDRSQFTLNPTSCDPLAFSGQALSALNLGAALNQRFQVGGCQDLSFKPKLSLSLKGGTKRGDHPAFTATLQMPPGGANIASAQVALPHSEFLDQAHIRTICTRVQFAANACPAGAIYGSAKAWTPLLDKPLEGPVYLRSSSHKLPDLIADLGGQIHVVLHGRTDSIHGGIRNTFEGVPDAPASKFVLSLKGGKKGLLINSRNICASKNRATAKFTAQSGKVTELRPALSAKCGQKRKGKGQSHGKPGR
jgi:hypothetical protein